jgi:glucose/arabinose dehydrogenase
MGLFTLAGMTAVTASCRAQPPVQQGPSEATQVACDTNNAGLTLPAGFCATLFAAVPGARHLAVSSDGVVYVGSRARGGTAVALRDSDGDGHADQQAGFGPGAGTGIAVSDDAVYFAMDDRVIRYPRSAGDLAPRGEGVVLISGLPTGGHSAKTLALGPGGALFVDHGSRTNSCQVEDRADRSPGERPCAELEVRAGIWRYDATRAGQTPADGTRWGTGFRNAMAIAVQPATGRLWGASHGRDQLAANWGFSDQDSAEKPAEEFGLIPEGADFGWPYCYYDGITHRKVLAPEYGGDGTALGDCAEKTQPVIAFPGHWAPMQLAFNSSDQFGAHYRGGAFLAFHGSWNRAPLPQAGFRVVFIPFVGDEPTGEYETFAVSSASETGLRPSGVAMGPDGALYIASDQSGQVFRVTRTP